MRLFPIIIIILLVFIGAIYWSTTFEHVEATTNIDNNSSMATGYGLTMDIAGFASQQWPLVGLLLFFVLLAGIFLFMMRGGE
jgi:ABC-type sulfate transport system permease component